MTEITKEDLEIEIELNRKAYETIEKLENIDFEIDGELKEDAILMCETVLEDTNKKINEYNIKLVDK